MEQEEKEFILKRLSILNAIQPDDLETLYVPRPDRPMDRILALLRGLSRQQKFLLTGQHGCGKSTELNKLAATVAEDYLVIRGRSDKLGNAQDLIDIEFLFVLLRILLRETENLDSKLHQRTIEKFDKYKNRIPALDTKLSFCSLPSALPIKPRISTCCLSNLPFSAARSMTSANGTYAVPIPPTDTPAGPSD